MHRFIFDPQIFALHSNSPYSPSVAVGSTRHPTCLNLNASTTPRQAHEHRAPHIAHGPANLASQSNRSTRRSVPSNARRRAHRPCAVFYLSPNDRHLALTCHVMADISKQALRKEIAGKLQFITIMNTNHLRTSQIMHVMSTTWSTICLKHFSIHVWGSLRPRVMSITYTNNGHGGRVDPAM